MKLTAKKYPVLRWLLTASCVAYGVSYSQQVMANPAVPSVGNTTANREGNTFREQYVCVKEGGKYATIAQTQKGPIELIVWESTFFGPQYTPEQRCQMVSQRFQTLWDSGRLKFLNAGRMNRQNVICATSKTGIEGCLKDGLLITLEPKDDPHNVLNELFFSRRTRAGGTFRNNRKPIDFKRLLKERSPIAQPAQNLPTTPVKAPMNEPGPTQITKPTPSGQPIPW
ncbi:COP23 domain-containing protein [Acaryochloris marina NIES-2412]|uniref:COP23 domain-containing protein n=1 Tax=Acaryochloris marina TaxID=155978 RepID=UPI004058CD23